MGKDNFHHIKRAGRKKREENTRNLRATQWLILSEGAKTEPNYFKGLVAHLNKESGGSIKIKAEGLGKNTKSLVNSVEKYFEYRDMLHNKIRIPYYKTVFVFDKDSFGANNFNGAISKADNYPDSIVAWSNESFELWLCLHFENINTAQSRYWYNDKLMEILRKKAVFDKNQSWDKNGKNDPEIFQKILQAGGCYKRAIKYSKMRVEEHSANKNIHSPAKANPVTMVYRSVEALIEESKLI